MSIEISALSSLRKPLTKIGEAGGLSKEVYGRLFGRLSDPRGKIAPKGSAFFGLNIGLNFRTLFTLNDDCQPVMAYVGTHDQYFELSHRIAENPLKVRAGILSHPIEVIKLSTKGNFPDIDLRTFNANFIAAAGIKIPQVVKPGVIYEAGSSLEGAMEVPTLGIV